MSGCATGKRFCPNFATIYVAEWEEAVLRKSSKSPLLYVRSGPAKPIGPIAPNRAPRLRGPDIECNPLSACQVGLHTSTDLGAS